MTDNSLTMPELKNAGAAAEAQSRTPDAVLYDRFWYAHALGLPVSIELRIILLGVNFCFQITADIAGQKRTHSYLVNGDQTLQIPLPYVGLLVIGVDGWSSTPVRLSFDLSVRIAPPFGLPPIAIVDQHLNIPIIALDDMQRLVVAAQSPADVVALIQLTALARRGGSGGSGGGGTSGHVTLGGDSFCISGLVDDGQGAVSFNIDVNGDFFGSTHTGTVTCPGAVTIVAENHVDGGGHYRGAVNGNIYVWSTQCANFAGVHEQIELSYAKK